MSEKTMLNTAEAAERLGVQKTTLEAWRCRGGGPVYLKYGNKAVRYPSESLNDFQRKCLRNNTSEGADR